MRIRIFKNAESLKDKVICEGESEDKLFFTFKDIKDPPLVTIHCNGKYTYLESCTCMAHSIHGGVINMKNLCQYVLAVYKIYPKENR
jgi:hypothetical protein|tara:strand:- start:1850 stop:2110 length:261 start_codon:yes stop_codon:yes gene_type:complete